VPGVNHPGDPVAAVAVADDPAGHCESADGEEDQRGEHGHAELGKSAAKSSGPAAPMRYYSAGA
jgi:hypothetical protein